MSNSMTSERMREIIVALLEASKCKNLGKRMRMNQNTDFEFLVEEAGISAAELMELGVKAEVIFNEADIPVSMDEETLILIDRFDKYDEVIEQLNDASEQGLEEGVFNVLVHRDDYPSMNAVQSLEFKKHTSGKSFTFPVYWVAV